MIMIKAVHIVYQYLTSELLLQPSHRQLPRPSSPPLTPAMANNQEPLNKRQETAISSSSPSWEWLPDDLWHKIFTHLALRHHRSLGSVSLVCRRFLALSNRTLTFFSIEPSIKPVPFPTLFSRFPNISSFRLGHDQDLDASITLLASSNLPLKSLKLSDQTYFPKDAMRLLGDRMCKTLKSISCVRLNAMNDEDLAVVAACFPYLQHFYIESYGNQEFVTDQGILEISTKLNSLVSVRILYEELLTQRSLQYLSSNCPSRNLQFGFGGFDNYIRMDQLDRFDLFLSLSSLHLERIKISWRVLVGLSKFNLKLDKLFLVRPRFTSDVTGEILCGFFKSCRSLRHLEVTLFRFPADLNAIEFAGCVPNIQIISLSSDFSHTIPPATLLYLLKNCPLLKMIRIACSILGITQDWFNNTFAQCLVRLLDLSFCTDLCDETLKLLVSVCPKLQVLSMMWCSKITQKGVEAVAATCNNIKLLHVVDSENFPDFIIDRRHKNLNSNHRLNVALSW